MTDVALKGKPQDSHESPGAPFGGNKREEHREKKSTIYTQTVRTPLRQKVKTKARTFIQKESGNDEKKQEQQQNPKQSTHSSQRRMKSDNKRSKMQTFCRKNQSSAEQIQSQSFTCQLPYSPT